MKNEQILKKHVGLIHCEGKLGLLQRKISNILIFNAINEVDDKETFTISLQHLCTMIGYKSNDIDLIKKALKQLISIVLEWNVLKDKSIINDEEPVINEVAWNASALLAGVTIEGGVINYSYSPQIRKVISSLDMYGQINIFVQSKFKSNYSLALYENCVRFKNIKQTCWFDLEKFRLLMGVDAGKYKAFKELSRNVINPAIKEINTKSDIFIEVEYKKIGRKISQLKFIIKDNEAYKPKLLIKKANRSKLQKETVSLLVNTFKFKETKAIQTVEKYGSKLVRDNLDALVVTKAFKQGQIKNVFSYLGKMLANTEEDVKKGLDEKTDENSKGKKKLQDEQVFKRKYTDYKVNKLREAISKLDQEKQKKIDKNYEEYIKINAPILLNSYKKHGLTSPRVFSDFLMYIQKFYSEAAPTFLSYDQFINSINLEQNVE